MEEVFDFVEILSDTETEIEIKEEVFNSELELIELNLEEFSSLLILNKKILILGNEGSGKSTLIEKITINTQGIIMTDNEHLKTFYSSERYKDNKLNIYISYGNSLKKRLFIDDKILIIDNCYINPIYFEFIKNNIEEKNMLFLMSSNKFIEYLNFDYIFLRKYSEITDIYIYLKNKKFLISFDDLQYIINEFTQDLNDILIIDCNASCINDLFLIYTTINI